MTSSRAWGNLSYCLCCGSFILGLVVVMPVMLILFANPSSPLFSIDLFEDQPINITSSHGSPNNMTINFHLKLRNKNPAVGLYYPDQIKVSFSYFPNVSKMVHLADYRVDGFYQGNGKTKHVRDLVQTNGVPRVLEGTDMVAFRVDLVGTFSFKQGRAEREKVEVGCVAGVNYTTRRKIVSGFVELVEPGLDSQLEPPPPNHYG